jgi:acyl-CoA thioesterase I
MRRDKLLVIALLGYSVIAFWGCSQREIKNVDAQGKNIICFGDSITFGYGVNPGEDYPSILGKLLKLPVFNQGVDSETTAEGLKRIESDVLDRDPYLVIIEFGGNDFLRKVPREETLDNIKHMVDKIQAKGAMVAIVDVSSGMILKEYRSAYYRIAIAKKALFIPRVLDGIITNPRMKSDFLHPNVAGYKLIAQRIQRAIAPYLKRPTLK